MKKRSKILLVHRYYHPDTPAYATMLKIIAEKLAAEGYEVSVLTSYPSYFGSSTKEVKSTEKIKGVNVYRVRLLPEANRNFALRGLNAILFALTVFFTILFRKRYDLVTVATTPPILVATCVRLSCGLKRTKYLYHCQDIYPEIAYYNNNLKNRRIFKVLQKLDAINSRQAAKNVVLSGDMKRTLMQERNIQGKKIEVINNFIRTDLNAKIPIDFTEYGIDAASFKIIFCGNLGKLQNLYKIIDLAKALSDEPDMKFIFVGEGVERKKLEKQAGTLLNKSVYFLGYMESRKAISAMEQSDLGIISISEPTFRTAYPSKTMTYLNTGLPVLCIIDDRSELAQFILDNGLGKIAKPDNIADMVTQIKSFASSRQDYNSEQIRQVAVHEFGVEQILNKWSTLIKSTIQ